MVKIRAREIILSGLILFTSYTEVRGVGLPARWERAVVFVEYERPADKPCPPKTKFDSADEEKAALEYCPEGTGFLMTLCGTTLLFSNRHVLSTQLSHPLFVRAKNKAGEFVRLRIGNWRANPHSGVDIAASTILLPPGAKTEDFDITAFNEDTDRRAKQPQSFLVKLEDVRVGDDVLLVGYPSSIANVLEILQTYDTPLFRAGIVSQKLPGITRLKTQQGTSEFKDIFLIDAWSFPGKQR